MAGMTAAERRDHIMAMLRSKRHATVAGLMNELHCSRRTLLYDFEALSASGFPIETVRGRYGGGVELPDWYQPHRSALSPEQIIALRNAMNEVADPQTRQALGSILDQFSPTR